MQIWFQNRRQNTRRKSRPLLPHEIAAFGLGGMAALSSDPSVHFRSSQGPGQPPSSSQSFEADTVRSYLPRANVSEAREHGVSSPVTAGPLSTPPADSQHDASAQGQVPNYSLSQPSSQQLPPPSAMAPGYFANRRSASSGHASTPMLERRTTFDTPNAYVSMVNDFPRANIMPDLLPCSLHPVLKDCSHPATTMRHHLLK